MYIVRYVFYNTDVDKNNISCSSKIIFSFVSFVSFFSRGYRFYVGEILNTLKLHRGEELEQVDNKVTNKVDNKVTNKNGCWVVVK